MRLFTVPLMPLASLLPLWMGLAGCSGAEAPEPVADDGQAADDVAPEPRRPAVPKSGLSGIEDARAPVTAPVPATIDLETADPMEIVEARGPGGEPATAMSLVVASRGDGEIEPCG